MLTVVDFLDKANIGFLTGDIHPFTINIVCKSLENNNDEQLDVMDKVYEKIKKSIFTVGK
jgi:hypothetical protein